MERMIQTGSSDWNIGQTGIGLGGRGLCWVIEPGGFGDVDVFVGAAGL